MSKGRPGAAALLLVLLGAACGGNTNVAANHGGATPAAPAVVESTITTTTTAPADVAGDESVPPADPAAAPVVSGAAKPAPGTIEVDYQPAEGATVSASISGPNGTHTKSLASGAAVFGNLPPGTYSITVTIDTPSDDPTVGDARLILNGSSVDLRAGDRVTITCDDSGGCAGVMGG